MGVLPATSPIRPRPQKEKAASVHVRVDRHVRTLNRRGFFLGRDI